MHPVVCCHRKKGPRGGILQAWDDSSPFGASVRSHLFHSSARSCWLRDYCPRYFFQVCIGHADPSQGGCDAKETATQCFSIGAKFGRNHHVSCVQRNACLSTACARAKLASIFNVNVTPQQRRSVSLTLGDDGASTASSAFDIAIAAFCPLIQRTVE